MLGVKFGQYHTWHDWGIIRSGADIPAPEPMRYLVEVPGRDGLLDVSGAVGKETKFRNREIRYTFHVKPGRWTATLSKIMSQVHGRTMKVIDDVDPDYYWEGCVLYDQFDSAETVGSLAMTIDAYPYKLAKEETKITITGSGRINCPNDRMSVTPLIKTTAETTIVMDDVSVALSPGEYLVENLRLKEGKNIMQITGTGTTEIRYRQGRL